MVRKDSNWPCRSPRPSALRHPRTTRPCSSASAKALASFHETLVGRAHAPSTASPRSRWPKASRPPLECLRARRCAVLNYSHRQGRSRLHHSGPTSRGAMCSTPACRASRLRVKADPGRGAGDFLMARKPLQTLLGPYNDDRPVRIAERTTRFMQKRPCGRIRRCRSCATSADRAVCGRTALRPLAEVMRHYPYSTAAIRAKDAKAPRPLNLTYCCHGANRLVGFPKRSALSLSPSLGPRILGKCDSAGVRRDQLGFGV